ncbi:GntR family transcriptional regulator [Gottschalkiaceae bacterium SANA]|nr:GntR family transcriptional regulator [Gottschalkiaceae bacterium SANA]
MPQDNMEIVSLLLDRIIELDYQPGELLNEKKLIEEFQVSRTPIREALLKLSEKGFVKMVPRVGTYVSQVDIREIKYAYEVKKNLEVLACELAAERASEEQVQELLAIVDRIEKYRPRLDYKKYIHDDYLFRKIIREASQNPYLQNYLEELNSKTIRFVNYVEYKMENPEWYNESLRIMAQAIEIRNSELAGREMKNHAEIFLNELSKRFFV